MLESWNLVWTCIKYIFFCSWHFIALRQTAWRWHGFENFRWIFRIGAQIFLTCTYYNHDLYNIKYLHANFQALFWKSWVCSISCINRLDYTGNIAGKFWQIWFKVMLLQKVWKINILVGIHRSIFMATNHYRESIFFFVYQSHSLICSFMMIVHVFSSLDEIYFTLNCFWGRSDWQWLLKQFLSVCWLVPF